MDNLVESKVTLDPTYLHHLAGLIKPTNVMNKGRAKSDFSWKRRNCNSILSWMMLNEKKLRLSWRSMPRAHLPLCLVWWWREAVVMSDLNSFSGWERGHVVIQRGKNGLWSKGVHGLTVYNFRCKNQSFHNFPSSQDNKRRCLWVLWILISLI